MKVIFLALLICLTLSDFVSEEWTGGQTLSYDLCNFEDMSGCDLNVVITYRADNEMDVTKWYEDGSGTEKKIKFRKMGRRGKIDSYVFSRKY